MTFRSWAIVQLQRHGIPLAAVAFVAWFLFSEIKENKSEYRDALAEWKIEMRQLKEDNQRCNDALIAIYRKDRAEMIQVIERNTEALKFKNP